MMGKPKMVTYTRRDEDINEHKRERESEREGEGLSVAQ